MEIPEEYQDRRTPRERRIEELTTLYNLASGGWGGGTGIKDDELAKRVLGALEKLILDTPFSGD